MIYWLVEFHDGSQGYQVMGLNDTVVTDQTGTFPQVTYA